MPANQNSITVVHENDAAEFIRRCEMWLVHNERDNNDILSVAYAIESDHPSFRGENSLVRLVDEDGICGCFIMTASGRIHLPDLPSDLVDLVCNELVSHGTRLRQISATTPTATMMANSWSSVTGDNWNIEDEWQAFSTNNVVMPEQRAGGVLRLPVAAETQLIENWGNDYGIEKPAPIDVATFLLGKVRTGELFVWDHNGPRTLIAVSAKTKHCARVSAVYTPPAHRRRGYASTAVATATLDLLAAGAPTCSLSVTINDVDVMRLYENIGYRKFNKRANIQLSS